MADSITLKSVQNNGSVTLVANNQTILLQGKAQGPQGIQGIQGDPATNLVTSVAGRQGVVVLDKTDVGLSNADNTSDPNKPISTATQAALDTKATTTALDAHANSTANPHNVTKAQVGLGNVSNLSPADMPVSTATQTALDGKANASDTVNLTGDQTVAGVKTFSSSPIVPTATTGTQAVNKSQMDTADALKVNKAGDTMTGRLASQSTILGFAQSRAGKNITFGASSNGDFQAYNDTDGNNIYAAYSDGTGLSFSSSGTQIRYGTGFPEGVVTAPVGSIYIDKSVTNGASSWIKKSGSGNTGWQVLEGDTGWRNVTALFTNLEVVSGFDYGVYIKREGSTIHLSLKAQLKGTWSDGLSITLPAGFRVGPGYSKPGNLFTELLQVAGTGRIQLQMAGGVIFVSGTNTAAGTRYYGSVAMPVRTDEEFWPTTLPGTAV